MKQMWQIRLRGVVQRMTRGEGNACLLQAHIAKTEDETESQMLFK